MFTLKLDRAKSRFFDRDMILKKADKATLKILSKHGSNVRTRAQRSLRYSKKASMPGKPPHAHKTGQRTNKKTGKTRAVSLLREYIFFSYEPSKRTVIVGPVITPGKSGEALPSLEFGGESTVRSGKGFRKVNIRPRPYMGPAGKTEEKHLPSAWRNSIK